MFQQLSICESANLQKLGGAGVGGKTVCPGAFVTVSEASVIQRGGTAAGPDDPPGSLPAPQPVIL